MKKLLASFLTLFLSLGYAENSQTISIVDASIKELQNFKSKVGTNSFLHNTIFISDTEPDSSKFSIHNYSFRYNLYDSIFFNSKADSNILNDSLLLSDAQLILKAHPVAKGTVFIEKWWRVYIDSSMEYRILGFEFNDQAKTIIFWDKKKMFSSGETNFLQNKEDGLNIKIIPIIIGKTGWHNLVVRQKAQKLTVNAGVNSMGYYSFYIYKNYISVIQTYNAYELSFVNAFYSEGFRFFLLCVFIISLLFYFIVQKTKSFLWFSIFSFSILCFSFSEFYSYFFDDSLLKGYLALSLAFIFIYSFTAFIFFTFSGNIPNRIKLIIIISIVLIVALVILVKINFNWFNKGAAIFAGLINFLLLILVVEIVVRIVLSINQRKKRIGIIAFGILQFFIINLILFILQDIKLIEGRAEIITTISIYLIPISFLTALIYLVKDSFTDNIEKQAQVLSLTQANEKILEEQNEILEIQVKQRTAEVVHQKELVEEKNRDILDSIEYAKRLQNAILPANKLVKEYLVDSFILYKPKDIVAGDFYWFYPVQQTNTSNQPISQSANQSINQSTNQLINQSANQLILFAAADCTGHGVPGAMVSVVCANALNKAVKELSLRDPGKILDAVNSFVEETFEKKDEDDVVQDGMDISLCALNLDTLQLQWSGANNPLILIQNAEIGIQNAEFRMQNFSNQQSNNSATQQLIELKPNKQPIGLYSDRKPFTTHTLQLQKGDMLYLFSDGFADQFGGSEGKKLMKKNLKNQLLNIAAMPIDKQLSELELYFNTWKGLYPQVDDVCVIGVRV